MTANGHSARLTADLDTLLPRSLTEAVWTPYTKHVCTLRRLPNRPGCPRIYAQDLALIKSTGVLEPPHIFHVFFPLSQALAQPSIPVQRLPGHYPRVYHCFLSLSADCLLRIY